MQETLLWITAIVFGVATLALATYGIHLYVLLFLFRRRRTAKRHQQRAIIEAYGRNRPADRWPVVTTQLPIYNEQEVARRVIDAVAGMDYPPGKHQIQVLDDSDDATRDVVDRAASRLAERGFDIEVIRRPTREGFKAPSPTLNSAT